MMKTNLIVTCTALAVAGCASQYEAEAKHEQQAKTMPVNCKTAEGDIRMLKSEKVSASQEAAAGASAIVPIGALAGLVTGTEGEKAQVATGDYDKALDQAIARIKSTCGIK